MAARLWTLRGESGGRGDAAPVVGSRDITRVEGSKCKPTGVLLADMHPTEAYGGTTPTCAAVANTPEAIARSPESDSNTSIKTKG